jgi:hypothetical protein
MKVLAALFVSLMFVSLCNAENILLSAATTDKMLVLVNIEYENKKFTIVDQAIFNLPFQAGLTALGRQQNGNYEVLWTAKDASNKIKLNSMIFDADLNKVGNIKKFARVLSSHFNLNLVDQDQPGISNLPPRPSKIAVDSEGNVYIANYHYNAGRQIGPLFQLFFPQPGLRPIDTSLNNFSIPAEGTYYASVVYDDGRALYGLLLGNAENSNFTKAYLFNGNVVSGDLADVPGTDNYNFVHLELLPNKRFRISNREFDGPTGEPDGSLVIHVTRTGDLGSSAFFNPFTVVQSIEDPNRVYTFFIQPNASNTAIDLFGYTFNAETQKRNSSVSFIDIPFSDPDVDFGYGLDGFITSHQDPLP